MITWLVLAAVVATGGIAAGVTAWLLDLRPRPDLARAELERGIDRVDVALLTGGSVRAIDTRIVDLIERGLVRVDEGHLVLPEEVDRGLDTPWDDPTAPAPGFDIDEAMLLVAVRAEGTQGLDAVRRRVFRGEAQRRLRRLTDRGLVVSAARRRWGPMIVAGPTLVGLFACSMALATTGRPDDVEWPAAITVIAWLPVTLLAALAWTRRPGYHGPDPRSRRGIDVVELVRARAKGGGGDQADRVAVDGFAGMTDATLRRDVQGDAVDSCWTRPRRRRSSDVNALLAVSSIDGGSDAGGGDGSS